MSADRSPRLDDLPPTRVARLDRACDRFEAAWVAGPRPQIKDFLGEVPETERPELLCELLLLKLELRRARGERPTADEYRARFPSDGALIDDVFREAPEPHPDAPPRSRRRAPAPDPAREAGLNLLFGVLALQNDFISRDDLLAAFAVWVADKARPLGQILVDRRALDDARRALLEALVGEHLKRHGDDPVASLAAVSSLGSVREDLEELADPDLQASLSTASSRAAGAGGEAAATATFTSSSSHRAAARFRVLRFHKQGGLGQIYVARDEELGRDVALKEIRPDKIAEADLRSRFVLEAEITGGLEHPGIVPVYSLGTYDDGRPFYAMRFVEGDSLMEAVAAYHRGHPRPDPTAVEFRKLLGRFVDVCEAIAFAHSKGVLHRDLKPHNVMLGRYGETLLIDWGLAKATGRRAPADPDAARESTLVPPSGGSHEPTVGVIGSPAFMSPEQATGGTGVLGPATDVYGLGAILYTLLTGQPPVTGLTADEVRDRACRGEITPPRSLNPNVPQTLEAVCLKALALRPEDRYPTARALADDIEDWLADEPVSACREPLHARAWRWVRKHRTLTTAAAAVALVVLAGSVIAYRREAGYSARLVLANAETEQWLNRAMGAIEDYYSGFSEEALRGGKLPPALRDQLLAKPLQFYEKLTQGLASKPNPTAREQSLLAGGRFNLGRILRILGRNGEAQSQYQEAIAAFEALAVRHPNVPDYQHSLAKNYSNLGGVLDATGRSAEAATVHRKAVAIGEALTARHPDVPDYQDVLGMCYGRLGHVLHVTGRSAEAVEAHWKAIAAFEALAARHPDVPDYQNGLAKAYSCLGNEIGVTGRPAEAVEAHRKAVAIGEALTARHPDVTDYQNVLATSYFNLGVVLGDTGRPAEAVEAHRKAVATVESLTARYPDVPDYQFTLASSYSNLGVVLGATGRPAEAVEAHRKAIAIREALAARHPDVPDYQHRLAKSYGNLGVVLDATGRPAEGAAIYRKAVAVYEALTARQPLQPDYRSILGGVLHNLGASLAAQGRHEEAVSRFREAVGHQRQVFDRLPQVIQYRQFLSAHYHDLAESLRALGRAGEAAGATRERIKLWPGSPVELYNGACELALCWPIARNAAQKAALADEAMRVLRAAVGAGWSDPAHTAHDPDLAPLHDRPDFQALVAALWEKLDRAMPADPFAPGLTPGPGPAASGR